MLFDVVGGAMLVEQKRALCIDGKRGKFVVTSFRGASVGDMVVADVSGTYNSDDPGIARSTYDSIASSMLR